MTTDPDLSFSEALQTAIEAKGISLAKIVEELHARGHSCTAATLSYWQSGITSPRRGSSLAILSELDDILDVKAGTFTATLARDMVASKRTSARASASPSVRSDSPNLAIPSESAPSFRFDSENLSFEREVERVTLIERIFISPDRATVTEQTIALVRAHRSGGGTFHLGLHLDSGARFDNPDNGLDVVAGAVVAQTIVADNETQVLCLEIPPSTQPRALHQIMYVNHQASPKQFTQTTERLFPWPLEYYSCQIHFDGQAPEEVVWTRAKFIHNDGSDQRIVRSQKVPVHDGTVTVSIEDVGPGSTVVQW